jgi:hypothetical protein
MVDVRNVHWWALAIGIFAAQAVRADEVQDRLAALRKKRESVGNFYLVSSTVTRNAQDTREAHVQLWESIGGGKQKARRVIQTKINPGTPEQVEAAPTMMVKDGERAWREVDMGDKKLVFSGDAKIHHEYVEMEPLLKKGVASFHPGEKILDHDCARFEIRDAKNESNVLATYWISERTGLVLKSVIQSAPDTTTQSTAQELNLDQAFSPTAFNYKPPEGAKVILEKGGSPGP